MLTIFQKLDVIHNPFFNFYSALSYILTFYKYFYYKIITLRMNNDSQIFISQILYFECF